MNKETLFIKSALVFKTERRLISYLATLSSKEQKGRKYLLWKTVSKKAEDLLEAKNFKKIPKSEHDEFYRDAFLREYNKAIASCSQEFSSSKVWWATDIASKDRFASKVPEFLYQFLTMTKVAKDEDYLQLIIVGPAISTIGLLKKTLKSVNIQFHYFGNPAEKRLDSIYITVRRTIGVIYKTVKFYRRSLYARKQLGSRIKKELNPKKSYYVIKTFIYNHSFLKDGSYRDVFFGSLPEFLKGKQKSLIYACILGDYKQCLKKISQCQQRIILPVEALLTLPSIVKAAIEFLFTKIRINRKVLFFGYDVSDIINAELKRTFKGVRFYHFLHYWSTKNLIKKVAVEKFLLTYENKPWERMCILALRRYSPASRIIGYQHTVVPQSSVNMFVVGHDRSLSPLPDKILTVGVETKKIMERYGEYEPGFIEATCGLRFEYLFDKPFQPRKRLKNILVALEGNIDVHCIVDYVLSQMQGRNGYHIKIRTHPMVPWPYFKRRFAYDLSRMPNVSVSNGNYLYDDIIWADIVIYWGTTVSLEALSIGKPVIHFDRGEILSYDPLFDCRHLKWVVHKEDSLKAKLDEI
ncbi:MAG: hypothetical protein KJ977_01025, partial [Candidatus Omnitrophica bacterium]|nr:hypothetical protein [Candidatus Omnitrophota bacterium]